MDMTDDITFPANAVGINLGSSVIVGNDHITVK